MSYIITDDDDWEYEVLHVLDNGIYQIVHMCAHFSYKQLHSKINWNIPTHNQYVDSDSNSDINKFK